MKKFEFREPLTSDSQGLFITVAQMQFFLNRKHGTAQFKEGHPEFIRYYKSCKLYNLIYEMMEEDEECATMYWDGKAGNIAITFPVQGKVAKKLGECTYLGGFDDGLDDDEDDSYLF